jgi:hypothetical protein
MNDADRIQLLFGPDRAPAAKRGDVAFCSVRDYPVLVIGWSAAPIPGRAAPAWSDRGSAAGCSSTTGWPAPSCTSRRRP